MAEHLSGRNGHTFNKGMLQQVATGKRKATNHILSVLGLPLRPIPAQPCVKCGTVHITARCTRRPTFEERTTEYERWRAKHLPKIDAIVTWAEQHGG